MFDGVTVVLVVAVVALLLMAMGKGKGKGSGSGSAKITIPGPSGLPILGSALQIDLHFPHLTTETWAKQYGGMCYVDLGDQEWVILGTYDIMYEAFVTKASAFSGRYAAYRLGYVFEETGNFAAKQVTEPEYWPAQQFLASYTSLLGNGKSPVVDGMLAGLLEDLVSDIKAFDGKPVDCREVIDNWSYRTFYATLTGKVVPATHDYIVGNKIMINNVHFSLSGEGSKLIDTFPWVRYLGSPTFKLMDQAKKTKNLLWSRLWDEAQMASGEVTSSTDHPSLMQALVAISDPSSPIYNAAMSDKALKSVFFDFVMGGSHHIARLVYALLNICLHHRDVLQRLQEEVDAVTNKSARRPVLEDCEKMQYTKAVVFELLRYVSPAPIITHCTVEDTTLGEYDIPAGTTILPNFWAVNHEEAFWGDPYNFRPERFLDDQGNFVSREHESFKHNVALGLGTRICPGISYTVRRLELVTAYLAQSFNIQPDERTGLVPCDARLYPFGFGTIPPTVSLRMVAREQ